MPTRPLTHWCHPTGFVPPSRGLLAVSKLHRLSLGLVGRSYDRPAGGRNAARLDPGTPADFVYSNNSLVSSSPAFSEQESVEVHLVERELVIGRAPDTEARTPPNSFGKGPFDRVYTEYRIENLSVLPAFDPLAVEKFHLFG